MSRITERNVIEAGIILAGGQNRNFTDLDISKYLKCDVEKIRKIHLKEFIETPLTEIKCPFCGHKNPIIYGIKILICCSCGGKIEEFPTKEYNLKYDEVYNFLQKEFLSKTKSEVLKEEKNKLLVKYKGYKIGVLIHLERVKVDNFYSLIGWCKTEEPDFYVMIGHSFDPILLSQDMKTNIVIFTLKDFFESKKLEKIYSFIRYLESLEPLGIKEIKYDLKYISKIWEEIIRNLTDCALQREKGKESKQGYKFQDMVILLLKYILPLVPKGGKNMPDAFIVIRKLNKRPLLIPVEIKSFRPKDLKRAYFSLREHSLQLRKYIENLLSSEDILSKYNIPATLVVAYDFDMKNKDELDVIEKLERDNNIKISLLPLKSLVKLCKLFFGEKMAGLWNQEDYENLLIPPNRYITSEHVENVIEKVKKRTKEFEKQPLKEISEKIKLWGRG